MEKPLVTNAADTDQIAKAVKKEKTDAVRAKEDMLSVIGTKQGRRVLWRLLKQCRCFQALPSEGIDRYAGKQEIGFMVMAWITEAREEALLEMMKEGKELELNV